MKKVQFPLVKQGTAIVYPDDISRFRNATIHGDIVVADYFGSQSLTEFAGFEPDHVIVTHLTFRRLFTFEERVAFDNFEENTGLSSEQKQKLRTITKDFEMAQEIDLKDPGIINGLQTLESCGILGEGRAAEVLAYRA